MKTWGLGSFALCALVVGCGADKQGTAAPGPGGGTSRTYNIGIVEWAAYAPLNVAEQKGFWKELGIDVHITAYLDNTELNAKLASREIDFAQDMMGSWVDMYLRGVPLVLIGETDWSFGGDKIIIKKQYMNRLGELKGQEVGLYLDMLSTTYFVGKFLADNGLAFSDFRFQQAIGPAELATQFIEGKYNLMLDYDPEALRAERMGDGLVIKTSRDYPGVIPEGMVARSDHLNTIPEDVVVKVWRGWIRGVRWAKDEANWEEYKRIMATYTFPSAGATLTDADFREVWRNVNVHEAGVQLERNRSGGAFEEEYLRSLSSFAVQTGKHPRGFQPRDLFNNTYLLKALQLEGVQ